jgi:hypothetical protein
MPPLDRSGWLTRSSSNARDAVFVKDRKGAWNLFFYGGAAGCPSDQNPSITCNSNANDLGGLRSQTSG